MAQYHVRDTFGYITVIEANKYNSNSVVGSFDFLAETGEKIASFLCHSTVSIVEANTAFQDIFLVDAPETDDLDPEETDDVCFDCRVGELLDSEVFFDAVVGIIDTYCCPDEDTPSEQPEEAKIPSSSVLKATDKEGNVFYGFIAENGKFVDFSRKDYAEDGLASYRKDGVRGWNYRNPSDFVFEEVDNG